MLKGGSSYTGRLSTFISQFNQILANGLFRLIFHLALFSVFAIGLEYFRIRISGNNTYIFLIWNLFLAWIPLFFSLLLYHFHEMDKLGWLSILLFGGAWLLFFPNAAYLVTDLVHYKARPNVPWWFDQVLLCSFLLNGLLLSFTSMFIVFEISSERINQWFSWLIVLVVSFLSGFGIYLGRFERWNSWDLLTDFSGLFYDILDRVVNPLAHPRTYGVTILFGSFLFLGFIIFRGISGMKFIKKDNY